jgi:hypothetical protein
MTYDSPTIPTHVTLGHSRDSRASRVPTPTPTPTKNVQRGAAPDLWEEPEKGSRRLAEPDAARRHEDPRAVRRGLSTFSEQDFRRFCAIVRGELATGLVGAAFIEHLKGRCAQLHVLYTGEVLERAVDAVLTPRPLKPEVRLHWRERCRRRGHPRECQTPTQCELRAAKETQ